MLRLLRALASLEVHVPSVGPYARFITGPESWRAWGELLEAVRTGETAFELVYGRGLFDYGREHPELGRIFNQARTSFNTAVAEEIAGAYDFSRFERIVDVGGGQGLLLAAILRRHPGARGVLFDLPQVVEQAKEVLEGAGVADRSELVGGDFFAEVPSGGDAYVLKVVIHDWDDERARRILSNCRKAMGSEGRLLVVERVIPERLEPTFVDQRGRLMDLNMLVLSGGRERTAAQFGELFESAVFKLQRLFPTPSGLNVLDCPPPGPTEPESSRVG